MKKFITLSAIAGMVLTLAPAAQAEILVPPLGYVGQYRVVFVTQNGTMPAHPANIGTLNTFASDAAATEPLLVALGTTWSAMAATTVTTVWANTATDPVNDLATSVPIYRVDGVLVADGYSTLWSGTLGNRIDLDQNGNTPTGGTQAYCGFDDLGATVTGSEWDSTAGPKLGYYDNLGSWAGVENYYPSSDHIYAISGVLTAVAPTEATILISGSGNLIPPGDTTPDLADDTDFGSVIMAGTPIVKTYTVSNFGTVDTLTLTSPATVTGDGAGQFAVGALSATVLAAGEIATFTVTYTPVSGWRQVDDATVSLVSDAADNNPYTFDITATTLNDGVITTPGDGYAGDYRIAFVTSTTARPTNSVIGWYNDFVTTAAAAVTELDELGVTWTCIGSTVAVSAKVNTGTDSTGDANDVPIYTTTGLRIADNNDDLWDGNIQNPIWYDDGSTRNHGDPWTEPYDPPFDQTWTGTSTDGSSDVGSELGSGPTPNNIRLVRGGYTDGRWITDPDDHDASSKHFLAMSGVLSTEPIPPAGTLILIK